ncbi:hypothetical protein A2477_04655 [Candidatus Falkowbacteria bacterium RIFOXYC2_FULL_47_12]|uniref:Uncharacterized protein n=2 Tax=Candidatus Falkowiibacteriota TaxID=1752728 RepID=A0A1F5TLU1_9BACT|nr:MAG: hypothetical protein A2242_02330 [Candidatus Falkowbacteria bacterium RIFOXYA2_FULL_47_9]OGF39819.1 MAG: hypothetical protein A2477_04655 [Candidatus Falkowbacteria bacterium RIFOXYC2_FULL_47_12]
MTTKEQFLSEHNRLSPLNLRATIIMLARFKTDKPALFKSSDWPIDKIRRPFILWLTSLTKAQKEEMSAAREGKAS